MKDIIVAEVASDQVDSRGEQFTDEALEKMAQEVANLPVRIDFNGPQVGHVVSAEITDDGKVIVRAEIDKATAEQFRDNPAYVVPSGVTDDVLKDGIRIISHFTIEGFGLTDKPPTDGTLKPISWDVWT